jgi:hypothetical protein
MKKTLLFAIAALFIFGGCKKDEDESAKTPPLAASTQTWDFGGLTWSDAIHDPACNKQDFDGGTKDNPKADGRSYSSYYYYSGRYVTQHAATLCPSPWRVPSEDDIEILIEAGTADDKVSAWGFGGFALGNNIYEATTDLYLWSSMGTYYWCGYDGQSYDYDDQNSLPGFQVRCVK